LNERRFSGNPGGNFIDSFPGTTGLVMVISGFFLLEVVGHLKHPAVVNDAHASLMHMIHISITQALGSSTYEEIFRGQYWRIIASTFLHGGILHFAMNMWVLVDLGRNCEPLLGTERFLATYFLCAIISSGVSVAYRYVTHNPVAAIGASGALAGLIGLLLGFSLRHRDTTLRNQILWWVFFIAVITMLVDRIDHAGHIGGFIPGILLGFFVPRYTTSASAARWRIPCWILCLATTASLVFAAWNYFSSQI
jgi:membrane associated rhomboid family serine protease